MSRRVFFPLLMVFALIGLSCEKRTTSQLQVPVAQLYLQQAVVERHFLRTYIDVTDDQHKPVQDIPSSEFKLIVDGKPASFDSVSQFQNTGEGVACALLIDVSGSVKPIFPEIQRAAKQWVSQMGDKDRIALLKVGAGREPPVFTANSAELAQAIDRLTPTDEKTLLYDAIDRTLRYYTHATGLPSRHVIVVITDGVDEDDVSGITSERVSEELPLNGTPIFAIGVDPARKPFLVNASLKLLSVTALASHGMYWPLRGSSVSKVYEEIHRRVLQVYVGAARCDSCPDDGGTYEIKVTASGIQSNALQRVFPGPETPWYLRRRNIWFLVSLLALLATISSILIYVRRKRQVQADETAKKQGELSTSLKMLQREQDQIKRESSERELAERDRLAKIEFEQAERQRIERERLAQLMADRTPEIAPRQVGLRVKGAPSQGYSGRFMDPLRVGKGKDCQVCIDDPRIADVEWTISLRGTHFFKKDRHGIESELRNGESFQAGHAIVSFVEYT